MMLVMRHIFSFLFSFLVAFYLLPLIAQAARRLRFLDEPNGTIKVHKAPVPYLGGLAVYIPFVATLGLVYPFETIIVWLLLGISLLLLVGLIDDFKVLKPGQKLFGQIIAVLCFLKGGMSLKTVFFSSGLNIFIAGFWMLSVINAFNLVDVMDGLSSLIAMVAALSFFFVALFFKQYAYSILLLAFLGPLLAFFLHNKPPAKIYLGDAGSMFIGGFLAAMPLLFPWSYQFLDAYYVPAIILGIPLLEVSCLVIIRTWLGIPFFRGSPHHFCIYLLKKGWSKEQVLLFTGLMGSVLSACALLFLSKIITLPLLVGAGILFLSVWTFIIFSPALFRIQPEDLEPKSIIGAKRVTMNQPSVSEHHEQTK